MVAVAIKSKPLGETMDLESMLQMFHLWMSLFRYTPVNPKLPVPYEPPRQAPSLVELGTEVDYSRWDVWMAYYETLSEILRLGYIYSPSYTETKPEILFTRDSLSDEVYLDVRLQQRAEIKKVEASIEAKLLEETRFPKANERNSRVERWVDAVVQNWRIMCGPSWQDEELGEGGKNAIARGILDVRSLLCFLTNPIADVSSRFSTVLPPKAITLRRSSDIFSAYMLMLQSSTSLSKLLIRTSSLFNVGNKERRRAESQITVWTTTILFCKQHQQRFAYYAVLAPAKRLRRL
jgi:hypothetical protein